jgi:phosphatidylserine decarboxylase
MKNLGKARRAAWKMILWTFVLLVLILAGAILATVVGSLITTFWIVLALCWGVFVCFTLFFFRDPEPLVPTGPELIIAPAHGKVDVIDEIEEQEFMGGPCKRVSIFLSVFNVHVQNAPVSGKVVLVKETPGQFLNAMKLESAAHNENVLIGFESSEKQGEKIGVRLIAGLIARRIVPWVKPEDEVVRGDRLSLIQFGSRVDIYLPTSFRVMIKLGDKVRGGETVVATRE